MKWGAIRFKRVLKLQLLDYVEVGVGNGFIKCKKLGNSTRKIIARDFQAF